MLPAIAVTPYHSSRPACLTSPTQQTPPPPQPISANEAASIRLRRSGLDANLTPVNPACEPGRHVTALPRRFARLTLVAHVLRPVERALRGVLRQRAVDFQQRAVERVVRKDVAAVGGVAADWQAHALLPQVAHEEL